MLICNKKGWFVLMKVEDANNYIVNNKNNVVEFYKGKYHASVPFGWANDPNGLSIYKGNFNLFYQHNPYSPKWDSMHWGHFTSKDLIVWHEEKIALAPDQEYECTGGCFSGSAIVVDDILNIFYTSVGIKGEEAVSKAISYDNINFIKHINNPIIKKSSINEDGTIDNFRDPFVFKKNGCYYLVVGGSISKKGNIFLFKSHDLEEFQYVGKLFDSYNKNSKSYFDVDIACECPSFYSLKDKDILMLSPMGIKKQGNNFQNNNVCVFLIGKLDFISGSFSIEKVQEIDHGTDFYAPLGLKIDEERIVMIAWKEMWKRTFPTQKDNWCGSFTLPRVLTYKDDRIYQKPVDTIKKYYKNEFVLKNIKIDGSFTMDEIQGNVISLELLIKDYDGFEMEMLKGKNNYTLLKIKDNVLSLDRTNSGMQINNDTDSNEETCLVRKLDLVPSAILKLEIFIDISSIEIFVNDGYDVMTMNVYPSESDKYICFKGNGTIVQLTKRDIVI